MFGRNEATGSSNLANRGLSWARIPQVLDGGIGWCALSLIALVAVPNGSEKIWWQAAFESAVFGLGALWIVNGFFRGGWPLKEAGFFVPLVALAAYAVFQTVPLLPWGAGPIPNGQGLRPISADPTGTFRFVAELLALIVLGKFLLDFTRDRRRLTWLVYVVIGISAASATLGIIRLMAQNASPQLIFLGQARGEGFAHLSNQNHFALMLEMALGLVLGLILGPGANRKLLLLHIGLGLLLASTIVFTTSRGGILAMVSQMLFLGVWFVVAPVWRGKSWQIIMKGNFAWQHLAKFALSIILILGLVIVVVIGIVSLGGDRLATRMEEVPGEWGNLEDHTRAQRGDVWRTTWQLIKDNPMSGVGFGAYETAITKYHDASGTDRPASALNEYLNLLAGGGAFAAGLAIWFMIKLTLRIRQTFRSNIRFERAASLGGLTGLVGVACHSFVDSGLQLPINAVFVFALMVIAISNPEIRRGPVPQREG